MARTRAGRTLADRKTLGSNLLKASQDVMASFAPTPIARTVEVQEFDPDMLNAIRPSHNLAKYGLLAAVFRASTDWRRHAHPLGHDHRGCGFDNLRRRRATHGQLKLIGTLTVVTVCRPHRLGFTAWTIKHPRTSIFDMGAHGLTGRFLVSCLDRLEHEHVLILDRPQMFDRPG
jgi:hypothetical protein